MSVYWIMFFVPILGLLSSKKISKDLKVFLNFILFSTLCLLIGLRLEVGGDWNTYNLSLMVYEFPHQSFSLNLLSYNIIYDLILYAAKEYDLGIGFVNLICAFFFVTGLLLFCSTQENMFLPLLIAVPYLIIVVAMGYTRQSAAIGLVLAAIAFMNKRQPAGYFLAFFIGAMFHKSCLIVMPFGLLSFYQRGIRSSIFFFTIVFLVIILISFDAFVSMTRGYLSEQIRTDQHADGAVLRVAMCLVPSFLLLRYGKDIINEKSDSIFWKYYSLVPFALFPLSFYASNLADRLSLYFIPLQLFVFSRIYKVFSDTVNMMLINLTIVVFYFFVFYIWLNIGSSSSFWIPYRNMLF